jgi:peptidoglycan hydrolase-like protein with peptidoglycan-binding domain
MFISGCVSLPQNQKYSELEERIAKIEERIDKIDKKEVAIEDRVITADSEVSLNKKIDKVETPKQFIKFPSNKDIQVALKNAGLYDGEIDGQIGTKTRKAIKEFQKQNDLEVDGVVGKNTWEVLGKYYYISDETASESKAKDTEEKETKEEVAVQAEANN